MELYNLNGYRSIVLAAKSRMVALIDQCRPQPSNQCGATFISPKIPNEIVLRIGSPMCLPSV